MKSDGSNKLDPMTMLAMAKSRQRQDRRAIYYLVAMVILVAGLALISWQFWPDPIPHVALAAYDAVGVPEQAMTLHARVEAENKERSAKIDGIDVRFQIAVSQRDETVATNSQGVATIGWLAPKTADGPVEFLVRHQHKDDPKNVPRNAGRVFLWPAKTTLLVVDVDHALVEGMQSLRDSATPTVTLKPGAAATLKSASAHYKIVYFTAMMDQPMTYRKLRVWLGQPGTTQGQLPDGPLLGPFMPLGPDDTDEFIRSQIESLKKSFPGEMIGIAGRGTEAKKYLDAGWKSLLIGASTDAPPGTTVIPSWDELPKKLTP